MNYSNKIKIIKKFYGLSRQTFHLISGISVNALEGYENGKEPPLKFKHLIDLMISIDSFGVLLYCSKNRLKESTYIRIQKKFEKEKKFKESELSNIRVAIMKII